MIAKPKVKVPYFMSEEGRKSIEEWAERNPKLVEVLDKEIIKMLKKEEANGDCYICGGNHKND